MGKVETLNLLVALTRACITYCMNLNLGLTVTKAVLNLINAQGCSWDQLVLGSCDNVSGSWKHWSDNADFFSTGQVEYCSVMFAVLVS